MLKNNLYVYGNDDSVLPAHLHFGKFMLQNCIKHGESTALIDADNDTRMTYNEFAQLAVDVALSLTKLSVGVGDVVSICSEKRMEFMPTLIGAVCAGATFSAADESVRGDQILYRLKITKPKVLFLSKTAYDKYYTVIRSEEYIKHIIVYTEEKIDGMNFKEFLTEHTNVEDFEAAPVKGWSDLAVIQFSSGTSGFPKAAKLTHVNFMMAFQNAAMGDGEYKDPFLSTREWYYTFGLYHTIACLSAGSGVVFTLKDDDNDYLEAIDKYKIKHVQIVPTTIANFMKSPNLHKYDVSSLETMFCTSIPLDFALASGVKECFPNLKNLSQIFGMTEGGCIIQDVKPPKGFKMGSVGVAANGTIIKVVDLETQKPVGPFQRGELRYKSLSFMSGYIGDTEQAYLDEEGFFKTGDIVYYDDDKYFYVVDRLKEIIKYKGCTLSPSEIENVLLKHPGILDVGVTSLPFSEAPVAFIVRQSTVNESDVTEFLGREMPTVTMSGGIRFVEKLPRGAGTKLDRKALRNMI